MSDGGVTALSGFLYQLLGSAAGLSQAANDHTAVLSLEDNGEDALLSLASGKTLVQFKYSAKLLQIQPAELAGILVKLEKHDKGLVCSWKLSTNRPYSPAAQLLVNGADIKDKALGATKPQNREVINRLCNKLTKDRLTIQDLDQQLSTHGRKFGLTQAEIKQGAARLVGAMIRLVADCGSSVPITLAFLDEQLVGFSQPGRLHGPDRTGDVAKELESLARDYLDGPELDDTTPRHALATLFSVPDEPVVIVTGPGGCGKSLSVLRAVRDHVNAQDALGGMLFSDRQETLEDLVANWRNPDGNKQPDGLGLTLERLEIANAASDSWILVLAVDGLDEDGWQSSSRLGHVRELVRRIRESHPQTPMAAAKMKLIMTCRDRHEVDHLLIGSGVGGTTRKEEQEISLEMFDNDELRETWSKWFPRLPFPKLAESESNQDLQLLSDANRATTSSDHRIALALRQPTILGCFKELDETQQRGLLGGNASAWTELMQKYLKWFTWKAHARGKLAPKLSLGMLSECAKATSSELKSTHDRESDWVRPALAFSGGHRADALRLFADAVTSGLVDTDEGPYRLPEGNRVPWRWRDAFVAEHLAAMA